MHQENECVFIRGFSMREKDQEATRGDFTAAGSGYGGEDHPVFVLLLLLLLF